MAKWQTGDSWLHYDYRQDVSYVYINIPKNASSWMKENFGGYLYDWRNNRFRADVDSAVTLRRGLEAVKSYVVILRDPISRWITGFAQSFWGWNVNDPNYYRNLSPDQWMDLIPSDDHTRPQIGYLDGLDLNKTTWFDCDQQLTGHATEWITKRFDQSVRGIDQDPDNGYNVSSRGRPWPESGVTQQMIIDHVRAATSDAVYQDRLRAIYQQDYDLRDRVEFYGSR